jgi:Fe2+ or Zn2+ uptake regulation protein
VIQLQEILCKAQKFKPTYHSFQVFGLCEKCQKE